MVDASQRQLVGQTFSVLPVDAVDHDGFAVVAQNQVKHRAVICERFFYDLEAQFVGIHITFLYVEALISSMPDIPL